MKNSERLVMTLLVRDEEDILERNICFHLSRGVDFILAIDNGSTDRTPDILQKFQKLGVLSYRTITKQTYEQNTWVSEMAKDAVEHYGATHLFHCDADEFWLPVSGNLKTQLPRKNEVFYVPTINYLPPRNMFDQIFGRRLITANGLYKKSDVEKNTSSKYLLFGFSPKVMTSNTFTEIVQGNHDVVYTKKFTKTKVDFIHIHHFPIRSYKQFERKVINGGSSYENNTIFPKEVGWHWRAWYELYKAGKLKEEYEQICLSNKVKNMLLRRRVVARIFTPRSICFAIPYFRIQNFFHP